MPELAPVTSAFWPQRILSGSTSGIFTAGRLAFDQGVTVMVLSLKYVRGFRLSVAAAWRSGPSSRSGARLRRRGRCRHESIRETECNHGNADPSGTSRI